MLLGGGALFSFLCVFFSFDNGVPSGLGLAAFFIGAGVGLGWLAKGLLRSPRPALALAASTEENALEHRILALAAATGRPLSIADVALHCNASLEQSKTALSQLVRAGVADVALDERNDLVYAITALGRGGT